MEVGDSLRGALTGRRLFRDTRQQIQIPSEGGGKLVEPQHHRGLSSTLVWRELMACCLVVSPLVLHPHADILRSRVCAGKLYPCRLNCLCSGIFCCFLNKLFVGSFLLYVEYFRKCTSVLSELKTRTLRCVLETGKERSKLLNVSLFR